MLTGKEATQNLHKWRLLGHYPMDGRGVVELINEEIVEKISYISFPLSVTRFFVRYKEPLTKRDFLTNAESAYICTEEGIREMIATYLNTEFSLSDLSKPYPNFNFFLKNYLLIEKIDLKRVNGYGCVFKSAWVNISKLCVEQFGWHIMEVILLEDVLKKVKIPYFCLCTGKLDLESRFLLGHGDNMLNFFVSIDDLSPIQGSILSKKDQKSEKDGGVDFSFKIKTYLLFSKKTNLYKIGQSNNPAERVKQIGKELEIIATHHTNIERYLHKKYREYREFNEWFRFPDDIAKDVIAEYSDNLLAKKEVSNG
jgi:hypothetical protein